MNKLINPILFIMCLFVTACSDDNNENEPITPFSLDKTYYEVRLERSATSIPIINGSGDISLAIEDENILNAIYSKYNDKENDRKGHINLYGMQKGSTTLTITDNITKDVETVEVKVTDCYLAYTIAKSNHPVLKANTTLFFVNNPEKEMRGDALKAAWRMWCYEPPARENHPHRPQRPGGLPPRPPGGRQLGLRHPARRDLPHGDARRVFVHRHPALRRQHPGPKPWQGNFQLPRRRHAEHF